MIFNLSFIRAFSGNGDSLIDNACINLSCCWSIKSCVAASVSPIKSIPIETEASPLMLCNISRPFGDKIRSKMLTSLVTSAFARGFVQKNFRNPFIWRISSISSTAKVVSTTSNLLSVFRKIGAEKFPKKLCGLMHNKVWGFAAVPKPVADWGVTKPPSKARWRSRRQLRKISLAIACTLFWRCSKTGSLVGGARTVIRSESAWQGAIHSAFTLRPMLVCVLINRRKDSIARTEKSETQLYTPVSTVDLNSLEIKSAFTAHEGDNVA